VFHVSDDVLLLARVVAGCLEEPPPSLPANAVAGRILRDACHAWELAVDAIDDSRERLEISARVVAEHVIRPFLGFNRAAHAVVEAAILVTRVHLLGRDETRRRIEDLRVLVDKTGGPREQEAFALLAAAAAG
jgi:hypothetical protein